MKIRTPFCYIEVEYLFLIFSFICIFSYKTRIYFTSFFSCYMFILFHELSHVLVASILGKKVELLKFSLSGMNAKFESEKYKLIEEKSYFTNMIIYLAGPLSNILFAIIFRYNSFIRDVNISLAIINLFPIYPLDGYNILMNVLGDYKGAEKCLVIIENIIFSILIIVSVYQLIFLKNISIVIFTMYIFVLKRQRKMAKNGKKYKKFGC